MAGTVGIVRAAVTEAQVKANADYMAKHLARYGWKYIVIDIQWSEPNASAEGYRPEAKLDIDAYGRLIPPSIGSPLRRWPRFQAAATTFTVWA